MITAKGVCGRCGAKISGDSTHEVCPACLLQAGLGQLDDESVASVAHSSGDDSAQAADRKKAARSAKILNNFGDYELLEEIGRGGQGVVYRARQKSLNRTVALKAIGLRPRTTEVHLKRFRREAEAAAKLRHPGIVPIHEVGERDGQCYFSMDFIERGQLDEVVKRTPLSIRQAAELIAKLARTVHYAHEHGILHRDIKPGNILLNTKGEPLLADFGLAGLVEGKSTVTRTLEVMGTPSYMAPEQATGEHTRVSSATDVYGLGAVLYQLLTGHPPFAGGTSYQTVRLLLDTEPRQPRLWNRKIDRHLSTICLKCLEKDPKRRYSSALALAEDLKHWLKHEPILARRSGVFTRGRKWLRRKPAIAALIASSAALAAAIGWNIWESGLFRPTPEKSIAVLPFSNLSKEEENAYFADGVQDEILTNLARIADLKVISRSSTMQYKTGVARNLREIAQRLRVANVVEGSVQRVGNRVSVHAQLVDARTDRRLWAATYDRNLENVFAIQSDIAKAIAAQLQANLSPNEKRAIEQIPSTDMVAFDLYTRAKILILAASGSSNGRTDLLEAVDLLNRAIARDPSFLQAYCQLASAHNYLYFLGLERTSAHLELANAAIEAAFRLRPDAGEAHFARSENLYRGYLDYERALNELDIAGKSLPNDPRLFELKGYILRRKGIWQEATRNLERAVELDPLNADTLEQLAWQYMFLRRYREVKALLERVLAVEPNRAVTKVFLASVDFHWKAGTKPFHQVIDSIRSTDPSAVSSIVEGWLTCALAERDPNAAASAMSASGESAFGDDTVQLTRNFFNGVIARMLNDEDKARAAFTAARAEQEKPIGTGSGDAGGLCVSGLIDAALGQKEEALQAGRRAVDLVPVKKDAIVGARLLIYSAMIAAWAGDKDFAREQLVNALRHPALLSYGDLKLSPFWDPLRGDPRFEKIVASLAPKEN